jgi:hypothetical protein
MRDDPERVARFAGENTLVCVSTPRVPIVAGDLLRDLGLGEATIEEQRTGVARWLMENEPWPVLRASLRRARLLG